MRILGGIAIVVVSLLAIDAYINGALDTVTSNTLTPSIPYFAFRTLTRMTIAYAFALAFALTYSCPCSTYSSQSQFSV